MLKMIERGVFGILYLFLPHIVTELSKNEKIPSQFLIFSGISERLHVSAGNIRLNQMLGTEQIAEAICFQLSTLASGFLARHLGMTHRREPLYLCHAH